MYTTYIYIYILKHICIHIRMYIYMYIYIYISGQGALAAADGHHQPGRLPRGHVDSPASQLALL